MKPSTHLSYYIFNALYSFFIDNGHRPHIYVNVKGISNPVIAEYAKDGLVCLNIGPQQCRLMVEDWGLDFDGAFGGRKQGCLIAWEHIELVGGDKHCTIGPMWFSASEFPTFGEEQPTDVPATVTEKPRPTFGVIQGGKQ